jgi:xanthine dehydrogenase accessory factor
MVEAEVFELIASSLSKGVPVALVTVLDHAGSTPGKQGSVMAVLSDGMSKGSVGGGDLEYTIIRQALDCLVTGISSEYEYSLSGKGNVDMACGGDVRVYIKVFPASSKLYLVGGGHIAGQLYKLALMAHFSVTIIDDRQEFANRERFQDATEIINADPAEVLKKMTIDKDTYIAIATHSHEHDEAALRAVAESHAAYIGLIGSKKKVKNFFLRMKKDGFSEETLNKIFAPMGLDIANVKPEEIAISIISEMLMVKNSGKLQHMKDRVK